MSTKPQLDPDPANLLGKGLLPPEREQRLLDRGAVFAGWSKGVYAPPFLIVSYVPIDRAIAKFFRALEDGVTGLAQYQIT